MGAWVFLVAGQIGGTNAWDRDEPSLPLLGADRIAALQADGVRFGSHGHTHVPLARVSPDQAADELRGSRDALSELLGHSVDVLAYPFSNQSRAVRHLAREAGYRCAVRGQGRMNSGRTDTFGLRRIKMDSSLSVERLRSMLFRERYLRSIRSGDDHERYCRHPKSPFVSVPSVCVRSPVDASLPAGITMWNGHKDNKQTQAEALIEQTHGGGQTANYTRFDLRPQHP
jgi:peptidoglycan/xylan/chitin deacetylase (PgdA/CDA1 family)